MTGNVVDEVLFSAAFALLPLEEAVRFLRLKDPSLIDEKFQLQIAALLNLLLKELRLNQFVDSRNISLVEQEIQRFGNIHSVGLDSLMSQNPALMQHFPLSIIVECASNRGEVLCWTKERLELARKHVDQLIEPQRTLTLLSMERNSLPSTNRKVVMSESFVQIISQLMDTNTPSMVFGTIPKACPYVPVLSELLHHNADQTHLWSVVVIAKMLARPLLLCGKSASVSSSRRMVDFSSSILIPRLVVHGEVMAVFSNIKENVTSQLLDGLATAISDYRFQSSEVCLELIRRLDLKDARVAGFILGLGLMGLLADATPLDTLTLLNCRNSLVESCSLLAMAASVLSCFADSSASNTADQQMSMVEESQRVGGRFLREMSHASNRVQSITRIAIVNMTCVDEENTTAIAVDRLPFVISIAVRLMSPLALGLANCGNENASLSRLLMRQMRNIDDESLGVYREIFVLHCAMALGLLHLRSNSRSIAVDLLAMMDGSLLNSAVLIAFAVSVHSDRNWMHCMAENVLSRMHILSDSDRFLGYLCIFLWTDANSLVQQMDSIAGSISVDEALKSAALFVASALVCPELISMSVVFSRISVLKAELKRTLPLDYNSRRQRHLLGLAYSVMLLGASWLVMGKRMLLITDELSVEDSATLLKQLCEHCGDHHDYHFARAMLHSKALCFLALTDEQIASLKDVNPVMLRSLLLISTFPCMQIQLDFADDACVALMVRYSLHLMLFRSRSTVISKPSMAELLYDPDLLISQAVQADSIDRLVEIMSLLT